MVNSPAVWPEIHHLWGLTFTVYDLASATFADADHAADIRNQERMIQLAGGNADHVIPGHDALQFQKYPTVGRVAKIK